MDRDTPVVDELTPAQHERYERVTSAIYELGVRHSLNAVARRAGLSQREVLRLVGHAFKRTGRRWELRGSREWPRGIYIIAQEGFVYTMVRSPRTAARIAEHYDAIRLLLQSHDTSALRAFKDKFIVDGYGVKRYFCTVLAMIRRVIKKYRFRIESMDGHWFFTEWER